MSPFWSKMKAKTPLCSVVVERLLPSCQAATVKLFFFVDFIGILLLMALRYGAFGPVGAVGVFGAMGAVGAAGGFGVVVTVGAVGALGDCATVEGCAAVVSAPVVIDSL